MVEEEPGQENKEVGRDDTLLSNKWVCLAIAVGAVLAVAFLVSLGFALHWYLSPKTDLPIKQRQALVQGLASAGQALAVLLTGAAGLLGLYLTRQNTNKQLRQARESTQEQLQQARESQKSTEVSAQKTLRLTEQGQITERFTRAIDQLGATDDRGEKKLEIRLGGIYALERIARESEQDYWPVMEIISAYVRQHARQKPATIPSKNAVVKKSEYSESKKQPADESKNTSVKRLRRKQEDKQIVDELAMLAPDIQAIVAVIRRLTSYYKDNQHDGKHEVIDLHETDLHGADLRRADLTDANLTGAILDKADLEEATLKGAKLAEAHLKGTRLVKANLEEAILVNADLKGALLYEAHLTGTYLSDASLDKASLDKANLQNARLGFARLRHTSFRKARLEGADLLGANLDYANLQEAHLEGADLRETTGLRGIPLPGLPSRSLLRNAYGDKNTKLPPNFPVPASWGMKPEEQSQEG